MTTFPTLSKQVWPHESVAGDLDLFYGNPRGGGIADPAWVEANITKVVPPWQLRDGSARVPYIQIHKKCADSLTRILSAIWEFAGQDQAKIAAAHLDEWGGSYVFRQNVNAPSKLSLHAYGAALDLAPDENPNGKPWVDGGSMLPRWAIDAFLAEGWCWGGDFNVTKDVMHFQATYNAHADAPQDGPAALPPVVVPLPVPPVVAVPPVAGSTDAHFARMRRFLLDESGVSSQLEAFKAKIQADVIALNAEVQAFTLENVASAPATAPAPTKPPPVVLPGVPVPVQGYIGITATVFGGSGDLNTSAYDGHPITDSEFGVALPYHFAGARPKVLVVNPLNGKSVTCIICDVGPWNTNDPYWLKNARPQAETGTDMSGRHTNLAGIDLTPAAAAAIGINGKGKVDWNFIPATGVIKMVDTPTSAVVPVQSAFQSKINWTQVVGIAASGLALFTGNKYQIDGTTQAAIVMAIQTITQLATIAFRTFGSASVTPQSLPPS